MKNNITDIDDLYKRYRKRYVIKKTIAAIYNLFIGLCGLTAVMYSVLVFKSNLFDRLRYMTFNGTIYTTIISFAFVIISTIESIRDTELTNKIVYYMRLSSAVTEFVIFAVVMFGLSPLVPDNPDIYTYPGVMMHLVVPICSLVTFIFNDAPIGKLKPLEPLHGTWFITIYAVIMTFLFGTGILPSSRAPYSFLDFENHSIFFSIACLTGIYIVGYSISLFLSYLNRKMSWIWYKGVTKQYMKEKQLNKQ